MKYVWGKYYDRLRVGDKIPRWAKKQILGYKLSKTEIRRKIALYKAGKGSPCCPYCGCEVENRCDHYVGYPDVWVDYYCMRCGKKTAYEDNSPYIHVLDDVELRRARNGCIETFVWEG